MWRVKVDNRLGDLLCPSRLRHPTTDLGTGTSVCRLTLPPEFAPSCLNHLPLCPQPLCHL